MSSCRRKTTQPLRSVRRKNFNSRYTSNCRFSMRERHFVLRKVIFFSLTRPKNRVSINIRRQHSVLSTKGKRDQNIICASSLKKRKKKIKKTRVWSKEWWIRGRNITTLLYTNGIFLAYLSPTAFARIYVIHVS